MSEHDKVLEDLYVAVMDHGRKNSLLIYDNLMEYDTNVGANLASIAATAARIMYNAKPRICSMEEDIKHFTQTLTIFYTAMLEGTMV